MKILEVNCRRRNDGRYTHQSRIIEIEDWYELERCFKENDLNNDILHDIYSDEYGRTGSILPRFYSVENLSIDSEGYKISFVVKTNNGRKTLKLLELMEWE